MQNKRPGAKASKEALHARMDGLAKPAFDVLESILSQEKLVCDKVCEGGCGTTCGNVLSTPRTDAISKSVALEVVKSLGMGPVTRSKKETEPESEEEFQDQVVSYCRELQPSPFAAFLGLLLAAGNAEGRALVSRYLRDELLTAAKSRPLEETEPTKYAH